MPAPVLLAIASLVYPTVRKLATTHRVSFKAKKKVSKPVEVGFTTKAGRKVSFPARKSVTKSVPIQFRAKNKK